MLVPHIFDPQSYQLHELVPLFYVDDGCPGGFELVPHLQPFGVSEGRASVKAVLQLLILVLLSHYQILQAFQPRFVLRFCHVAHHEQILEPTYPVP